MSEFDMNTLLRSYGRSDDQRDADESADEEQSIGGKADGGAGGERGDAGATDRNTLLRDAVFASRGRGTRA